MKFSNESSSFLANSNSNMSVINYFSKYSTLMEYLVNKLEARIKSLPKARSAIANISNIQELVENKKDIIRDFFDIEDDFKQGINAIKALIVQNRDLTEQIESTTERVNSQEMKSSNDLNIINELNERNNDLIEECNSMRMKFGEIETKSSYLREKILEFEKEFNVKERLIEELKSENNSYLKEIERLSDENALFKIKIEGFEKNFNDREFDCDEKSKNNIENISILIAEKEFNKKLIEDKVKSHFQNKSINIKENIFPDKLNQELKQNISNSFPVFSKSSCKDVETVVKHEESKVKQINQNILSEIIMSALESEETITLLNKRFGKDFMEKLLSKDVSNKFLKDIDDVLKLRYLPVKKDKEELNNRNYEFEEDFNSINTDEGIKKLSINESNQFHDNKIIIHDNQERPEKYKNNENKDKIGNIENRSVQFNRSSNFSLNKIDEKQLSSSLDIPSHNRSKSYGIKYKSKKPNFLNFPKGNHFKTDSVNFQENLRNYGGRSFSSGKNFVNFTNPHSYYFDETLQKGGKSKLDNILSKSSN